MQILEAGFWHVACGMRDAASGKWQTAQAACLPFKLDLCITQINKPKHTQRQRLRSLPTLGHRFASFHISLNKIDEQPQSAAQSMPEVIAHTSERIHAKRAWDLAHTSSNFTFALR